MSGGFLLNKPSGKLWRHCKAVNKGFSIFALPQGRLLALIALWWGVWLCAARWAYPRFVDSEVLFLVVGSIGCFVGAALLALRRHELRLSCFGNDSSVSTEGWPAWGLLGVVLYQLFLEHYALGVLLAEGAGAYRTLAFSDANRVFGNWKLIWLYDNFLMPFGLYCVYRWLANDNKQRLWVFGTIVFFVLDALTHMGRFPLYMMLVCFGIAWVLRPRKISFAQVLSVTLIFIGLLALGAVRNGGANGFDGWVTHLSDTVINYHIYGFGILGCFVQGLDHFYTPGIPFLTAGFLWSPIHLFEALMKDLAWVNYYGNFNAYIQHPFDLGSSFMPNAFTTLLLPFWLDGGGIWLFAIMTALGLLFGSAFVQKTSLKPSGLALIIAHVMVFGIFQPILNSQWFFVPLLTHFFATAWIRYRHGIL